MRKKKGLNILVVDDEKRVCELFHEILKEEKHRVTSVTSGEEAVKRMKREPFDVVFLDVVMPGMDGLEAFKAIKRLNPKAIVVMMTGFAVEEKIKEALRLGAIDYLTKPFDVDEILTIAQVAQYLNLHQLTVYKLVKEGGLPAFKVGGQWRFKKKILDRWISQETKRQKSKK